MAVRVAENTGYHVTGVKNTLNTHCQACLMEASQALAKIPQMICFGKFKSN